MSVIHHVANYTMFANYTANCANSTTRAEPSLGDYSPQVAFDFIFVGTDKNGDLVRLNDFAMDWAELIWSAYFAIYFGLFGSTLERFSLYVYSCNMFGFYVAWTLMRDNPVFMDPVIFDQILRILLSAGMASFMLRLFKVNQIMQAWTIVTIAAKYSINLIDLTLRLRGGCDMELGDPNQHFILGSWKNCDDWTFAYAITWAYAGSIYIVVFITGLLGLLVSRNKTIYKWCNYAAVAMTATSFAIAAMRSGVRLCVANDIKPFNNKSLLDYTDYVFWGVMVFFIVAQECISRWVSKATGCIGCCYKLTYCIASPMIICEYILQWVEKKALELNMTEDEKEVEEVQAALKGTTAKSEGGDVESGH